MKRWTALTAIFFILLSAASAMQDKHQPMNDIGDYKQAWNDVDALDQVGKTRSAYEQVLLILEKARKEDNAPQFIKALLRKSAYRMTLEEESEYRIVAEFRDEAAAADAPDVQAILHSVTAELIWQYYQANRYRFLNRSAGTPADTDDFRTWDLATLLTEVRHQYDASLVNADYLQNIPVSDYDPILMQQEESERFRPTLYDLLVHRALDFLMNGEAGTPQPVDAFSMEQSGFLSDYHEFSGETIEGPESLRKQALLLFRELIAFRISDQKHPAALMDADLKRLQWVYRETSLSNKSDLLRFALRQLQADFPFEPYSAMAGFREAELLNQLSDHAETPMPERISLRKEALEKCRRVQEVFPKSIGAANARELQQYIERPTLQVTAEQIYPSDEPLRVLLNYGNIDKVGFRLVRLTRDEAELPQYGETRRDDWMHRFLHTKPYRSWEQPVQDPGDLFTHSTEAFTDPLPYGTYLLFVSEDGDFTSDVRVVEKIRVSDLSYLTRQEDNGTLTVFVTDRRTGAPVQGAIVQPFYYRYDYTRRENRTVNMNALTTGYDGRVSIPQPEDAERRQIGFSVAKDDDYLSLDRNFYLNVYKEPEPRWRQEVHFFTDRAIYRPGQTIWFKGLVTETNGSESRLITHRNMEVTFRDVNYKEVAKLALTTNEFGSVNGSFIAPSGGLNGTMTLVAHGGQTTVHVEEYKRPSFEVVMDTLEGSQSLNRKVTVTGAAITYAGAPVSGATVRYRVVREVRYPWWPWWRMGRMPYQGSSKEIAFGEASTSSDGSFSITFTAEGDADAAAAGQPVFHFRVMADVTDISGETRSAERTVRLSKLGLTLQSDLPAAWNRDESHQLKFQAFNLDGKEQNAEVSVKVFRLGSPERLWRDRMWAAPDLPILNEEQFKNLLPYEEYKVIEPEERVRIPVGSWTVNTTDTDGIHLPAGTLDQSGEYLVEATTRDEHGQEVPYSGTVEVFSPSDKSPAVPVPLNLRTSKGPLAPGDMATVTISSSLPEAHILFEVSHDGKPIRLEWLSPDKAIREIQIPVTNDHWGGIEVKAYLIYRNRTYSESAGLDVPFPEDELQVEWSVMRDLLAPGEPEQWQMLLKGSGGDAAAAELLATMYDKSLDQFVPHDFYFHTAKHPSVRRINAFNTGGNFIAAQAWIWKRDWTGNSYGTDVPGYDALHLFGLQIGYPGGPRYMMRGKAAGVAMDAVEVQAAPVAMGYVESDEDMDGAAIEIAAEEEGGEMSQEGIPSTDALIVPRGELQETAFFYPELRTNENGEIVLNFTAPEALTTWKFLGFAHDKQLRHVLFSKEVKTNKDLMVTPNQPRFFREGDRMFLTARVDNLTSDTLAGSAWLVLKDGLTGNPLPGWGKPVSRINLPANGSTVITREFIVPKGIQAITTEWYARAADFTDGVMHTLPVLTNRILVTESLPLWMSGAGERTFSLDHLMNTASQSLTHHQLTLEYTSNPAWYAVQALPYLMEFPHECAEQLFSRYYANRLASHISNSNPAIRKVFERWKLLDSDALLSQLEKNQELKSLMIEETPWLRDAESETERKKRIALLFDMNRMANEQEQTVSELRRMQLPNGGFPWFNGMRDNRYITQQILSGIAHLEQLHLPVDASVDLSAIVEAAIPYLDARIAEDLKNIQENDKNWKENNHLSSLQIHYLYVRSQFRDYLLPQASKEAVDYFLSQADKYWLKRSEYDRAMLAIALNGYFRKETARLIVESLDENAIRSEEMGMYWKSVEQGGYRWNNAPIETQSMLIEAFHTVTGDEEAVNAMKRWLLKQKQVQDWGTTKATAEAVYALLLRGDDWLSETRIPEIILGGIPVDPEKNGPAEPGTGYFKVNWDGDEIEPSMGEVKIVSDQNAPGWGALYWQYFEDLDQIQSFRETPLTLKRSLYVEEATGTGPKRVPITERGPQPGDRVIVQVELRVDRHMEFVHLKDMRASGFEPENVLSRYRFQDGLGYYQSTRDAATHFFFDQLPKGVYVFEYPLRAALKGTFSNGISTIRCMYAPEYSSHSAGTTVEID